MTGLLATFLLFALLASGDWWLNVHRQAARERRLEGLLPFSGPRSNVRPIPPPFDIEKKERRGR